MRANTDHSLKDLLARTPLHLQFCQHCGSREKPSLDHIVPISRGGSDAWDNIQILCSPCNNQKGDSLDKLGKRGKLRVGLREPLAAKPNQSGRPGLHAMTLDQLWRALEDAKYDRGQRRRIRLDALAREIQRRESEPTAELTQPKGRI